MYLCVSTSVNLCICVSLSFPSLYICQCVCVFLYRVSVYYRIFSFFLVCVGKLQTDSMRSRSVALLLISSRADFAALISIAYSPARPGIGLHCGGEVSAGEERRGWRASAAQQQQQQQVITTPPSITILIDFQLAIYIRELVLLPY